MIASVRDAFTVAGVAVRDGTDRECEVRRLFTTDRRGDLASEIASLGVQPRSRIADRTIDFDRHQQTARIRSGLNRQHRVVDALFEDPTYGRAQLQRFAVDSGRPQGVCFITRIDAVAGAEFAAELTQIVRRGRPGASSPWRWFLQELSPNRSRRRPA